jgi:hypothetical protein
MTDFNAKHRELYLEELKEVLKKKSNYIDDFEKNQNYLGGIKVLNLSNIKDLINKFDIKSKDVLIELLRTLKDSLNEYDFKRVCEFRYFFPHEKTLYDCLCVELFKDQLIDIILDNEVKDEQ